MSHLLDLPSWRLGTGDLLQNLGLLAHLNGDSDFYTFMTKARVVYEGYSRISSHETVEALEALAIKNISDYVKAHPNASQDEIAKEVNKHVEIFKQQVALL